MADACERSERRRRSLSFVASRPRVSGFAPRFDSLSPFQ